MEITAKKTIKGVNGQEDRVVSATINVEFGNDLGESIDLFGDEVVYSNFVSNAKITGQQAIRRMLETGSDQDAIETRMSEWKPGQKLERVSDPVGSFKAKLATMGAEERAALLAELMDI